LIIAALGCGAIAGAQARKVGPVPSGSESSLVGVRLYDPGTKIVAMFGSPSEIQAVSFGGGGAGPSGGGGAPGPGGRGGGGVTPGGAGSPGLKADPMGPALGGLYGDPFQMGGSSRQLGEPSLNPNFGGGGGAPPAAGGGRGGGAPAAGGGGGGSSDVVFTRWVYNRGGSQYGFVFDKFNRVVQIEAIGISDTRVKSRRGIRFGSSFASVISKYKAPEGYDISADNIMVRYLQKDKIAFRLSRLKPNGPHQVTGIVVAAGTR